MKNPNLNLNLSAVPVGQNYAASAVATGVALEIISPQLNINGVVVRTLGVAIGSNGATGGAIEIMSDITAPTSGLSTSRVVFTVQNPNSSGPLSGTMPYPLYLYPGQGMWAFSSAPGDVFVTWDYLNPV